MDNSQTLERDHVLSKSHLMQTSSDMESDGTSLDTQFLEQIELAQEKILEQQKEIMQLKRDKVTLLKQVTDLCLALEGKEDELNDFIQSYEQKTLETARYLKELNLLAEELESTSAKLSRLERLFPRGQSDSATQTPTSVRANQLNGQPRGGSDSHQPLLSGVSLDGSQPESMPSSAGTTNSTKSNAPSYDSGVACLSSTESPLASVRAQPAGSETLHRRLRWLKIDSSLPGSPLDQSQSSNQDDPPSSRSPLIPMSARPLLAGCSKSNPTTSTPSIPNVLSDVTTTTGSTSAESDLEVTMCRLPPFCWTKDHVAVWMSQHVGMPAPCVRKVAQLNIDGPRLAHLVEASMEKMLGLSEYYLRRKLALALEDLRVHGSPGIPKAAAPGRLTALWVANDWLSRQVGLARLAPGWLDRGIDARLVSCLPAPGSGASGRKEASRLVGMRLVKRDAASLMAGAELLRRVSFDVQVLSRRREVSEITDVDPVVWTNQRVAKWLADIDLTTNLDLIENSGLHGALMVLDPNFTANTLAKMLHFSSQMVKACRLEDRFLALVKPARLSESVNIKRSTSIFRTTRRSSSQPRGCDLIVNKPVSSNSSAIGLPSSNQSDLGLSTVGSVNCGRQVEMSDLADPHSTPSYTSLPRKFSRASVQDSPDPVTRLDGLSSNQNTPSSCSSGKSGPFSSPWSTTAEPGQDTRRTTTARVLLKKRISLAATTSEANNNRAEIRRKMSGPVTTLVSRK